MFRLIFVLVLGLMTGLPTSAAAEVSCPNDPDHPGDGAVFVSVYRTVEVQRGGAGPWIPAKQLMPLCRRRDKG